MQEYTFKVEKYTSEVQKYTFEVQKDTFEVQKCKSIPSKYESLLEVPRVDFANPRTAISKWKSLLSHIRPLKYKNILSK